MLNIGEKINRARENLFYIDSCLVMMGEIDFLATKTSGEEDKDNLIQLSFMIKNRIGKIKETLSNIETFELELYLQKYKQFKDKGMKL